MIRGSFTDAMVKYGPDDVLLYKAQDTYMSIVLDHALQTSDGKRFNRKNKDKLREVWRLHEEHQTSSATNSTITSALSQEPLL